MTNKVIEEGKGCAITAYLLIGIIWYFVDEKMRKNSFAKFHVQQSIVLLIASVIASIAGAILAIIPFIGFLISIVLNIAVLVLWIMGILNAVNGKEKELPIIGNYAKNINI